MLYIIIIAAGVMSSLHFYGFKRFLKLFLIPDRTPKKTRPAPAPAQVQNPPPVPWYIQEQIERAELEAQAFYILTLQGHTCPGIVKYTSNIELIQLINAAHSPNYKQGRKA